MADRGHSSALICAQSPPWAAHKTAHHAHQAHHMHQADHTHQAHHTGQLPVFQDRRPATHPVAESDRPVEHPAAFLGLGPAGARSRQKRRTKTALTPMGKLGRSQSMRSSRLAPRVGGCGHALRATRSVGSVHNALRKGLQSPRRIAAGVSGDCTDAGQAPARAIFQGVPQPSAASNRRRPAPPARRQQTHAVGA